MLQKLKTKYQKIDFSNLENVIIIICFLFFIISLLFVRNIILIILIELFLYFLASFFKTKEISFINNFLPILILGYFLFHFINFNFIEFNVLKLLLIIIKILFFINYLLVFIELFKKRKIKLLKTFHKRFKYYSFKELRSRNIEKFRKINSKMANKYIKENAIEYQSDYYKVIDSNIENKSKVDLEEYVWINYLRFYKNKKYHILHSFNQFNFVFLLIHVIILILSIFVR